MNQDVRYSVFAFLGGAVVMVLLIWLGLEFQSVDWIKWFGFVIWTAMVFGAVAWQYAKSIDEISRCSRLFYAILAAHAVISILYLRSVADFPKALFFSSPVEIALVACVLVFLGGARAHRSRVSEKTGEH
jgi:hypothetical protein